MGTITVRSAGTAYDVVVTEDGLTSLGDLMRERGLSGEAAVVTDETVAELYGQQTVAALESAGFGAALVSFAAGEKHKTLLTVESLYSALVDNRLERGHPVVALGGGVVGDTAGFVAATFLRGVPLVQVPTTLLAMVDSSVGGKVGVDLPQGKNLVGAFKQPELVLADVATLRTLPEREFRAGLAEVIKAGVIGDPTLFQHLEQNEAQPLSWIIGRAIQVKRHVVEDDPFESGRRAVLNLGHTFGHALEVVSDYRLLHGFAVSVGMVIATRVSARLGLADNALADRIIGTLANHGLPVCYREGSPEAVWDAMATDKKRTAGTRRYVLPRAVGDVFITSDVPKDVVIDVLRETCEP